MSPNSSSSTGWPLVAALVLLGLGVVQTGDAAARFQSAAQQPGQQPGQQPVGFAPATGVSTADSNGSMIAVTGLDVTGTSILYLVDTEGKQLSVYQATGGTGAMMSIRWVGARRIDLDLLVDGFNDKSEYSYKDLSKQFGPTPAGRSNGSAPLQIPVKDD